MKKGFFSIQFLLSIFIFIIAVIFVIFVVLIKSQIYFKTINEKNRYLNLIVSSKKMEDILYLPYSQQLNMSTFNLLKQCGDESRKPGKVINPYYLRFMYMISLNPSYTYNIQLNRYAILVSNSTIDAYTKEGLFNETVSFKIKKSPSQGFFNTLNIDGTDYSIGDSITLNDIVYIIDYIENRHGSFAILKNISFSCGPRPYKTNIETTSFKKYSGYENALYEFVVTVW